MRRRGRFPAWRSPAARHFKVALLAHGEVAALARHVKTGTSTRRSGACDAIPEACATAARRSRSVSSAVAKWRRHALEPEAGKPVNRPLSSSLAPSRGTPKRRCRCRPRYERAPPRRRDRRSRESPDQLRGAQGSGEAVSHAIGHVESSRRSQQQYWGRQFPPDGAAPPLSLAATASQAAPFPAPPWPRRLLHGRKPRPSPPPRSYGSGRSNA